MPQLRVLISGCAKLELEALRSEAVLQSDSTRCSGGCTLPIEMTRLSRQLEVLNAKGRPRAKWIAKAEESDGTQKRAHVSLYMCAFI
jgi:hypothetical protein